LLTRAVLTVVSTRSQNRGPPWRSTNSQNRDRKGAINNIAGGFFRKNPAKQFKIKADKGILFDAWESILFAACVI
jgi:hypothetical protein